MERLLCSKCGVEARCGCGAPYVSKLEYARTHMDKNKSDGANAKKLGISQPWVSKARQLKTELSTESKPTKRKGKDGKMYSGRQPEKKNGAGSGRPRKGYSLKYANTLRGKAHDKYCDEWAIDIQEKGKQPKEKWQDAMTEVLNRVVGFEKEWEQYGDWRKFDMYPCTYELITRAAAVLNGLLSSLKQTQVNHRKESDNVVHH